MSSEYSFRRFEINDLKRIDLLDDERELILDHAEFFAALAGLPEPRAYCGTTFIGDELFYIGAWYEEADGVCRVFVIPSANSLKRPKTLLKTVREWIAKIEQAGWAHRIQTLSLPIDRIDRWMEALGFLYEGTLRQYSKTGQDYKLWSRVKQDGVWRDQKPNTRLLDCVK